jgi:thiamine-monophosphate kinase
LKILLRKAKAPTKLREELMESVLMPHARLMEGLALAKTCAVRAAIDSSDGLAWSLHEIAQASKVGFLIDKLPVDEEVERFAEINGLDSEELALHGGEEYELVLTVNPKRWREAARAVEKVGGRLLQIGKVTAERQLVLKTGRRTSLIESRGYEHFK